MEFILVALRNVRDALREFRFEPRPRLLLVLRLLGEEQAKRFLRAQLGDSCVVLHSETIQNLSAFEFAFAQTERAFDSFVHQG